ncbi:tripartite tricarboxylate transporter TctB family protein [Chelativorans sp. M5D2P16]|uniref:tripartite tricarboxylate transporter TctB family protein n=1 Tax=Chelativorans sp. M5D2P16 TaxID=3095678 RepID=UPI002ACA9379|nr:tripartite tricarboxylate transporter TctB family protein [Chelativorans sp. M5D2P16]MDZ5696627.1 tripartite tricarboxylate transporter TctB family protein [Chelativorans sp. M5D2P16]
MFSEANGGGGRPLRASYNTVVALGCIALGVAVWLMIPYQVQEPPAIFGQNSSGISPTLFPRIAAIGFILIGALYFVASLRMNEPNPFRELPALAYGNLAVVLVAMVLYVALLRPLGYALSSALVASAISLYYGSRNVFGIAFVGVVAPLAIYYLFTRMLTVSLPPFPWN